MEKMISAAIAKFNQNEIGYAFIHDMINGHKVTLKVQEVNSGSKNNQFTHRWYIDGKPASAAKVAAL